MGLMLRGGDSYRKALPASDGSPTDGHCKEGRV